MLSVQNVFYHPKEKHDQADSKKAKFLQPEGDHLTILTVYNGWRANQFLNVPQELHIVHNTLHEKSRYWENELVVGTRIVTLISSLTTTSGWGITFQTRLAKPNSHIAIPPVSRTVYQSTDSSVHVTRRALPNWKFWSLWKQWC